jgi:hypothetical protein
MMTSCSLCNYAYQKKADYRLDFGGIKRFFSSGEKNAASPEVLPQNCLVPLGHFRSPGRIMGTYGGKPEYINHGLWFCRNAEYEANA